MIIEIHRKHKFSSAKKWLMFTDSFSVNNMHKDQFDPVISVIAQ